MNFICYNGKKIKADVPIFTSDNRGYRYGDGFFETLRVTKGKIPLLSYHIKRIELSLQLLQYKAPETPVTSIIEQIHELCETNHCTDNARVRLSFSNGSGSVFANNEPMDYLIEANLLDDSYNKFNEKGLLIGICPHIQKSSNAYSNLKSANFLIYRVAADYALRNNWNDALILNQNGNIIETTIANLFWVKEDQIFTSPLSEGCVKGTMRSYLLESAKKSSFKIEEKICTLEDLQNADEIFVTNAVNGLRWVHQFENKTYQNKLSRKIYDAFIAPLWAS